MNSEVEELPMLTVRNFFRLNVSRCGKKIGGNLIFVGAFLLLLFVSGQSYAAGNHSEIGFGGGQGGVFDEERRVYVLAEYRSKYNWKGIAPIIALHTSGRESYITSGIFRDFEIKRQWFATPAFSVGLYFQEHGVTLGSNLEFKSSFAISYKADSGARFGARIAHVSNGGISEYNPGSEMLTLFFTLPVTE